MKYIVMLMLLIFSSVTLADTLVHGYYKKNGTYVKAYHRKGPQMTPRVTPKMSMPTKSKRMM
jgi:hypothetical protein